MAAVLRGDHEPDVIRMGALIVVRDLGVAVDRLNDALQPLGRGGHGGQGSLSTYVGRAHDRSQTGQGALVQQPPQPVDDLPLLYTERVRDLPVGPR